MGEERKSKIFGLEPDQLGELFSLGMGKRNESEHESGEPKPAESPPEEKRSDASSFIASLESSLEQVGQTIGSYRLVRILGEGGMGIVYLAEQEQPIKRQVALKIIKPGMDSARVIGRFKAERQTLALLDHPNISHVYEAGTTGNGRLYFVMEHVKGLAITEFCDQHQLNIDARLRLFQRVCYAVQHAHQKGIIHRDIKPSNILVSQEQNEIIPRIIDFGIAKAICEPLTERTRITEENHLLGTPEYMSPEQAEVGTNDIDTRSDVYSLGVLLYVLLAGILPFDPKTLRQGGAELVRKIIREQEPQTPSNCLPKLGKKAEKIAAGRHTDLSALTSRLHKELEWIPLKAMRKERSKRYQSASALADDIGNYLRGAPLAAGPPSKLYRLRKFARRNQVWLVAVTLVTVAILAGFVVSTAMYYRAQRALDTVAKLETDRLLSEIERLRAYGRYGEALALIEPMLEQQDPNDRMALLHAQLLLDVGRPADGAQELEELTGAAPAIAGAAHYLLAQITLGTNPAKADRHRQQAEAMLPSTPQAYYLRATTAETPTEALQWLDQALDLDSHHYPSQKAKALLHYGLHEFERLLAEAEALVRMRRDDSLGYSLRAVARRQRGKLLSAIEDHDQAIALCMRESELPDLYYERCRTYMQLKQFPEAIQDAQHAVALKPTSWKFSVTLFKTLFGARQYKTAERVYHQGVQRYPWAEAFIEGLAQEHALSIMEADQDLDIPAEFREHTPFVTMARTVESYRGLAKRAIRLCAAPPASLGGACWSPDGKKIAYSRLGPIPMGWRPQAVSDTLPTLSRQMGIDIFDLDSNTRRSLTSFGGRPRWSPDGHHISFMRGPYQGASRGSEIWIISTRGGRPRRLVRGTRPNWTLDSSRVLYKTEMRDERSYSIRIDDPNARPEELVETNQQSVLSGQDYRVHITPTEVRVVKSSTGVQRIRWPTPWPLGSWGGTISPNGTELSISGSPWGTLIYDMESDQIWHVLDPPGWQVEWAPDRSKVMVQVGSEWWILPVDPSMPTYRQLGTAVPYDTFMHGLLHEKNQALTVNPRDAKCRFELALLHLALDDRVKAKIELEAFGDLVTSQDEYLIDMIIWWARQYCRHDVYEEGEMLASKAVELLERFPGRKGHWTSFFKTPLYTENPFRDLRGLYLKHGQREKADACTARFMRAYVRLFGRAADGMSADTDPNGLMAQGRLHYDETTGTYTACGAGVGIWGAFDQFHFAHKTLHGNGSLTVQVQSLDEDHPSALAGVMIRSSLEPSAPCVLAFVAQDGTVALRYRGEEAGHTEILKNDYERIALPHWIRLVRQGDTFSGQHSSDGILWKPIMDTHPAKSSTVEVPMDDKPHIGLAVTSCAGPFISSEAQISQVTATGIARPQGPFLRSEDIGFPRAAKRP